MFTKSPINFTSLRSSSNFTGSFLSTRPKGIHTFTKGRTVSMSAYHLHICHSNRIIPSITTYNNQYITSAVSVTINIMSFSGGTTSLVGRSSMIFKLIMHQNDHKQDHMRNPTNVTIKIKLDVMKSNRLNNIRRRYNTVNLHSTRPKATTRSDNFNTIITVFGLNHSISSNGYRVTNMANFLVIGNRLHSQVLLLYREDIKHNVFTMDYRRNNFLISI